MNPQEVFTIRTKTEFKKKALHIFRLQAKGNPIYKKYVEQLGVDPEKIQNIEQIPFLPIELFKTQKIVTGRIPEFGEAVPPNQPGSTLFLSSGTTAGDRSKHYVSDLELYENSCGKCFEIFYGDVRKYTILAFLPSYYENKNSSLLYMVNNWVKNSKKKESRFYQQHEEKLLFNTMRKLLSENETIILLGVSYALLDLSEKIPLSFQRVGASKQNQEGCGDDSKSGALVIMETGGMKGRRKEIIREELHKILCEKFAVKTIHSEYGMTELLSQAYSDGKGIFKAPPWMQVLVRDPKDPFSFLPPGRTGVLNIIDLANIHSCSFIATQDIGRAHPNASFEVLGRLDNSDLRGCNLLVN